jgi:hypothetical protein
MDFVTQLPRTVRGKTAIMVVVDRLSKQCHLVVTRDEATLIETAKLFVKRIYSHMVCLEALYQTETQKLNFGKS